MSAALEIQGLTVEAVTASGGWNWIVRDVDVCVDRSEVVALIGESGAGKSTVALSALGYARGGCRITGGHVYFGDTDVLSLGPAEQRAIRGRRVAYVAQSAAGALNPAITIGEQVAEGLVVHKMAGFREGQRRAVELFRRLDLPQPESLVRRYPHQISGGQQQRVILAMALACSPEVLVLDEPTTALDVTTQIEVLKVVKSVIRDDDSAAIYVSHDLAVVAQIADRIVVMSGGEIVEQGTTHDILNAPCEPYTKLLMEAVRPPPRSVIGNASTRAERPARARPVLAVRNIRASYQKRRLFQVSKPDVEDVLHDIEFSIERSEVVAVVGESGSGKSTLARVVAGLHQPDAGAIDFEGEALAPMVRQRPIDRLRRMQLVVQSPDTSLNPAQRIEKVLGRPLDLYFALDAGSRRIRVSDLLQLVGLPAKFASRYPTQLSGGEKQRVSLARALAADPAVVLCDEVLSSLDTVVAASVLELLKDLQTRLGVAIVFISHDLATVASIADHVMVLYAGRICEFGLTEEVFSPPYHPYTALLISSVPELREGWLEDVLGSRIAATAVNRNALPGNTGCAFFNRCPLAIDGVCDRERPPARTVAKDDVVYCHRDVADLLGISATEAAEERVHRR